MYSLWWLFEFLFYYVLLSVLALRLEKKYPNLPVLPFFVTAILAVSSHWHYWQQTWDLSSSSLYSLGVNDDYITRVLLFAAAYMIADLPIHAIYSTALLYERIMFSLHHLFAFISIVSCLYYGKYVRLMFFFITAEATNIFLNGSMLLSPGLVRTIAEALFAVTFFGYRMLYLFPVMVRSVTELFFAGLWFDLFVLNIGPAFIGGMHIWWCWLVIDGMLLALGLKQSRLKTSEFVNDNSQSNLSNMSKFDEVLGCSNTILTSNDALFPSTEEFSSHDNQEYTHKRHPMHSLDVEAEDVGLAVRAYS